MIARGVIARGDALALAQALVRVDSRNPVLVPGGPGEREVAALLAEVLRAWDFRVEIQDAGAGRPNVLARIGPAGAGVLMFNGHLDVVSTQGMTHPPFDAEIVDGMLHGRGAADMKGGIAAMCAAAVRAHDTGSLATELLIAAVADEEHESLGTRAMLDAGVRADAAIVTEPTNLAICPAHRGFAWIRVILRGRAAHGSRYDLGVDAIRHAGLLLAELDVLERDVLPLRTHALLGRGSLHASVIEGGTGLSTYPEHCSLTLERRMLPGERAADAVAEVDAACQRVGARTLGFSATVTLLFAAGASDVSSDAPVVRALRRALGESGERAAITGMSAWTDAALLNDAGIPAICFGPGDIAAAHAAAESVDVLEIERATRVLAQLAVQWPGHRHG